jgi:head-tail adaptor
MSVFTSLLNHTFTVSRRRRTPDGQGGWAIDYVALGTIQGRIRPATSVEREQAALEQRQITHVFYCLASETIARGDRLTVGDLVVDVEGIREPSKAGEHLEVDCLEIQQEQSVEEGS